MENSMGIIGITGGTGLIGSHITQLLIAKGYRVVILTRHVQHGQPPNGISYALWKYEKDEYDIAALSTLNAVIHLAGESIAAHRWTAAQKQKIASSRIDGTKHLVQALHSHAPNCRTFIAASAIGYYGADAISPTSFTEDAPAGTGFLADTCIRWEAEIQKAQAFARTIIIRNGIVLAKEGGAFPQLIQAAPFRVLPIPGNGRQFLSWIHIADIAALYVYALEQHTMQGIYNGVAPQPVSYNTLMQAIATANGGAFLKPHIPAPLLRIALGEMSIELLKSATVHPQRTIASGYAFQYPAINAALQHLLA